METTDFQNTESLIDLAMARYRRTHVNPRRYLWFFSASLTGILSAVAGIYVFLDFKTIRLHQQQGALATVGALLQGIVGSSIALAGAWATIRVAELGLELVDRTEARERQNQCRDFLIQGLGPITKLAVACAKVHAAAGQVLKSISTPARAANKRRIDEPDKNLLDLIVEEILVQEHPEEPSPFLFFTVVDDFFAALRSLCETYSNVLESPIALSIWKSRQPRMSAYQFMRAESGHDEDRPQTFIEDSFGMATLLRARVRSTDESYHQWSSRDKARFVVSASMIAGMKNPMQGRAKMELITGATVMLAGSLIWHEPARNGLGIQIYGSALFTDLVQALPSTEELLAFSEERFYEDALFPHKIFKQFISNIRPTGAIPDELNSVTEAIAIDPRSLWISISPMLKRQPQKTPPRES